MIILGLNIYHGDAAACIFKDGHLIVAAEEERFTRVKHSAGFPIAAINFCLESLDIRVDQVDFIAINRNPELRIFSKLLYFFKNKFKIKNFIQRFHNFKKITSLSSDIARRLNVDAKSLKNKILFFDHHLCHAASSVYASGFENTNYATIDGFGDFVSTTIGEFKNDKFYKLNEVQFPHSLGIFYTAITQFLGFENYGDEYKVMGLASYGKPIYFEELLKVVNVDKNLFKLNLNYFKHHTDGIETSWLDSNPNIAKIYKDNLSILLGSPPREKNQEILSIHKDIAASAQAVYEFIFFDILKKLYTESKNDNLCLSGGCAMNSVANGKIINNTPYKKIFINHSPADSGGAIGAALLALKKFEQVIDISSINNPYLGNNYSNSDIKNIINSYKNKLLEENIKIKFFENEEKKILFQFIAKEISNKKIIGFFNGRMEFGARALGNRSILADPRDHEIKNILNLKIKRRESFRPFAPSILKESVKDWFDTEDDIPFMSKVYKIKNEKKDLVSAVVHIDGTCRLQTVDGKYNQDFCNLIKEFYKLTNVPIILNTSFNENEPIVRNPEQAIDCFLRTKMDYLVIENFILSRNKSDFLN
jgi:carbamoyltransferase